MNLVTVLDAARLLIEGSIGSQAWVLAALVVGMAVFAWVVYQAGRRGVPMTGLAMRGAPIIVTTLFVAMLAFGSDSLTMLGEGWILFVLLGVGAWALYVRVLESIIESRAAQPSRSPDSVKPQDEQEGSPSGPV